MLSWYNVMTMVKSKLFAMSVASCLRLSSVTIIERKLLAVIWACESLRPYLLGSLFVDQSDHANLQWLGNHKQHTGRLARWLLRLGEFDYEVRRKPGRDNVNVDALSLLDSAASKPDTHEVLVCSSVVDVPSLDELRVVQESDPVYGPALQFLRHPDRKTASDSTKEVLRDTGHYCVNELSRLLLHESSYNGELCRVPVLPPAVPLPVVHALHSLPTDDHLGRNKTYHRHRTRY